MSPDYRNTKGGGKKSVNRDMVVPSSGSKYTDSPSL